MIPNGVILTIEDLSSMVSYYLTQDCFVVDIESSYDNRLDPNRNTVTWISFATHGSTVVIPLQHPLGEETGTTTVPAVYGGDGPRAGKPYNKTIKLYSDPPAQLDAATAFAILKPLFASPNITKIGHDAIFDLMSVAKYIGFIPVPPFFCTKVGFWLLDENRFTRGLKEMTELRYDFKYDFENVGACVENHPFSLVAYYSYCDAKFDFLHYLWVREQLEKQNLTSIFSLEMDVLNVLIGMRQAGVSVDVEKIKSLKDELSLKLPLIEQDIYRAAGRKFNINSSQQKQDVLFDAKDKGGQGLRPWKLTDGGKDAKKKGLSLTKRHYSTDDAVLESFAGNPVADKLREYGDIDKILNTYVGSWLGTGGKDPHIVDGKIHAGFLQYGTVTGRLSCRSPNLQNISRSSTELGKMLRKVFIAEPGSKLIAADYSQIELVVLAHYLEQGALYEGFLNGIDPHTMTAALVLGKSPEDITKDERQWYGKSINFAVIYGAGITKVASMAHTDSKTAKKFLGLHEEQFPEIYDFKDAVIDLARSRKPVPYITTLMGRKRRVPELLSHDDGRRLGAERQIFNSLIQGGAADIMKLAMVRVDALLPDECQMRLSIHDEIVISSPDYLVDEAVIAMRKGMLGKGILSWVKVPLKIDLHVGQSWYESKG